MTYTALIIEDETLIALDIQNKLKRNNIASIICADEAEIYELVKTTPIDIILADIALPGDHDGIEIITEINTFSNIPVIFITAYDEDDIITRIQEVTPFGYILKPFDEKELYVSIMITLNRHAIERKLIEKEFWITSILNNISDAVIVTDASLAVTFMNAIAIDICHPGGNYQGKKLSDVLTFMDKDNHTFNSSFFERIIRTQMPVMLSGIKLSTTFPKKDMLIDGYFSALLEEEKKVSGIVINIKRLTE